MEQLTQHSPLMLSFLTPSSSPFGWVKHVVLRAPNNLQRQMNKELLRGERIYCGENATDQNKARKTKKEEHKGFNVVRQLPTSTEQQGEGNPLTKRGFTKARQQQQFHSSSLRGFDGSNNKLTLLPNKSLFATRLNMTITIIPLSQSNTN